MRGNGQCGVDFDGLAPKLLAMLQVGSLRECDDDIFFASYLVLLKG